MRKFALIVCLVVSASALTRAAVIGESEARVIAGDFMARHQMGTPEGSRPASIRRHAASSKSVSQPAFYVFNATGDNGFVIVAADDAVPPILGYCDRGSFDDSALPANVQWWLGRYEAQAALVGDNASRASSRVSRVPVSPFLTSTWNQIAPYNNACPLISSTRALTGCVATAMAQILYHYKSPVAATGITTLPSYTFNYGIMKDSYNASDTGEGVDEMAKLLYYCTQALGTKFSTTNSTAASTIKPLVDYFGYSNRAAAINHDNFTLEEWENIIYDEVAAGRPVQISARTQSDGHTILCDGCDAQGLFHINWGWGGKYNGYFRLDLLNPYSKTVVLNGTETPVDMYTESGFSLDQMAMLGIEPAGSVTVFDDRYIAIGKKMTGLSTPYTRTGANSDFSNVRVGFSLQTSLYAKTTFECAVALCDEENHIKQILSPGTATATMGNESYATKNLTLAFGAGLADGTYRLCVVTRPNADAEWRLCYGATRNYLTAVVAGNTLRTTVQEAYTHKLVINSLTPVGDLVVGRPVAIRANITNKGTIAYSDIYMYMDGKLTAGCGVNLLPGETGDFDLCFTPTAAGTKNIEVWDNEQETLLGSLSLIIAERNMNEAKLNMSIRVDNGRDDYTIVGDSLVAVIAIRNDHTLDYDNEIYIQAHWGNSQIQEVRSLKLASGQSKTIRVTFHDLAYGQKYYIKGRYLSKGVMTTGANSSSYTMVEPSPVTRGDVNGDGLVSGADVTALYGVLLDNKTVAGNADVSGDGVISGADVTALYNLLLE